jgi:hypothetical protein
MAIKCYVKAADVETAERAAWDIDWTTCRPGEARVIPRSETRRTRLYEVTITAKPMRKLPDKKGGKS